MTGLVWKGIAWGKRVALSSEWNWLVCSGLLLWEALLNAVIILRVPYTEIDWIAYMQEVAGVFDNGEASTFDYTHLRGDTGPLVYPAGFVYLYYFLYRFTDSGVAIRLAQWVFAGLHLLLLALVFYLFASVRFPKNPQYARFLSFLSSSQPTQKEEAAGQQKQAELAKEVDAEQVGIPGIFFVALCLSKRIHSIFVLRLFNDCWAMTLCYLAMALFCHQRWKLGCFFYSLAVSIKMNILLFAPALFLILVKALGLLGAIVPLTICALVQLLLAVPFLLANPVAYLAGSFDLGRKFFFIWTVNWKFLPEPFFLTGSWSLLSLGLHVAVLLLFAHKRWCAPEGGLWAFLARHVARRSPALAVSPALIVSMMFTSNFIGIVFARSLHYQFYVWYFHTLPFLCCVATAMHSWFIPFLLIAIEISWNIFPATPVSSLLLFSSHILLLSALWASPLAAFQPEPKEKKP